MPKRTINKIIVHHSASGSAVTTVEKIRKWHVEGNGWSDIGYHFVIYPTGEVHTGRPMSRTGAHCKGHNKGSIGICVAGNFEVEPTQEKQEAALFDLIDKLCKKHKITWKEVYGHKELGKTLCPGTSLFKALVNQRKLKTQEIPST